MPEYVKKPKPQPSDYDWIRDFLSTHRVSVVKGTWLSARCSLASPHAIMQNKNGEECIFLESTYGVLEVPLSSIKEIRQTEWDVTLILQ